jgi:hypothetical protein
MSLGPSLPPAELARRDSALFVEVKCILFTTLVAEIFFKSSWIETQTKESHWMTERGLGTTDASGQWLLLCAARGARVYNQRVRSLMGPARPVTHPGEQRGGKFDRTRWRVRSHATRRVRSTKSLCGTSLDSDRTLALSRPVVAWSASGHTLPESVTFHDRWKSNERNSKRDTWRATSVRSMRAERHLEPNGSILWGCL